MNLYSILDLGYVSENQVVDCATSICKSGVVKLQLRAKAIDPKKIFNLAKLIKPICNDYSIPLIINDYPESIFSESIRYHLRKLKDNEKI